MYVYRYIHTCTCVLCACRHNVWAGMFRAQTSLEGVVLRTGVAVPTSLLQLALDVTNS